MIGKIFSLGIYSLLTIGTIEAGDIHGYVLRNIEDKPMQVCVEDHLFRPLVTRTRAERRTYFFFILFKRNAG